MILGLVVVFGLIMAFGVGMALLYLSGWVSVQSTPERLTISRRKTNRYDPPEGVQPVVSWPEVRSMELACLGKHYHRLDGSTKALGMEPVVEDPPWEAVSLSDYDHDRQVANTRAGRPAGQDTFVYARGDTVRTPSGETVTLTANYAPGLDDFGNLTAKDIGDMRLPEFDQLRRQFLATGDRVHRGMFG